jgi:hypothetical protein
MLAFCILSFQFFQRTNPSFKGSAKIYLFLFHASPTPKINEKNTTKNY